MWVWNVALFLLFAVNFSLGCGDSSVIYSTQTLVFILSPQMGAMSYLVLGVTKVDHSEEGVSLRFQKTIEGSGR